MQCGKKEFTIIVCAVLVALTAWFQFEYPRYSVLDLSVDKRTALAKAQDHLLRSGFDTSGYSVSIVFNEDRWCNRYLQKTIGPAAQERFLKTHNHDLFYWRIRYFKELKKEEYVIKVSPQTGAIISFRHLIDDVASASPIPKEMARLKAQQFLQKVYDIDFNAYDFHEEKAKRYDQRVEYNFSWQKKGVYIAWDAKQPDLGGAKLLVGATVSGEQIREFYKSKLIVPERFERFINNQFIASDFFNNAYTLFTLILLMVAIALLVKRKDDVIVRAVKRWYVYLAVVLAVLSLADIFNALQQFIIGYPTSTSFSSFVGLYLVRAVLDTAFVTIGFMVPGMVGESLCNQKSLGKTQETFLHFLKSSFYTKRISRDILLGYAVAVVTLGLQAVIFYIGQRYAGVWRDWVKLTHFSSTYLPLLSILILSVRASFNEEIFFRLFGIGLVRKYLRSTVLAVVLSAIGWGLGHTGYAIYPVWFRILEVSIIGILYGVVFLRYGIVTVVVGHFLFDTFWGSAAYILGKSHLSLHLGPILILSIPFAWAVVAYCINRKDQEKDMQILLNDVQKFNLEVLTAFLLGRKAQGVSADVLSKELLRNNWDHTLVAIALREVFQDESLK